LSEGSNSWLGTQLDRKIQIPIPDFCVRGCRGIVRARLFQTIGWNLPLLLSVFGFLLGFMAVNDNLVAERMGFQWAVVNEKTLRAQSIILWTASHLVAPLIVAVIYNSIYLLRFQSRFWRVTRLVLLIASALFLLWYFEQGFYLSRKLVTI